MSNPNEDPRVITARSILHEPPVDLSDHGQVVHRVGRLEAALSMVLRFVDELENKR